MTVIADKTVPELRFPEFGEDWRRKPLKALSSKSISYGIVQTGTPVEDGVKCVRVVDLTKPRIDFNELITTSEKISQSYKKTILSKNEIMVALRGEIGLVAAVSIELEGSNLTRGIARIAPKESEVHSSYLLWALRSPEGRKEFHRQVNGSALKEIPIGGLNKIPVQLTSLSEQRKIADFLTAVDRRIGQLIQKKALLEDYKKGVMQQLFTQAIRFKDDHGNDFPDWEEKKLGELGATYGGLSGKSGEDFGSGKPYVTYNQIFDRTTIDLAKCKQVQINPEEKQNRVKKGDILFTTSSETRLEVGYTSVILEEPDEVYLNSFCFGFRLNENPSMLTEFARYLFHSTDVRRSIAVLGQGSTRYNLSKKELMKQVLLLPSTSEQTKIANFLSAIDSKIESVATQITETQTFKRGLLQQMFV